MTEVMLRPDWPASFRRTVRVGKKGEPKTLIFLPNTPTQLSDDEFLAIAQDVGVAVFEIERDAKGRPRYVEASIGSRSKMELPASDHV